MPEFKGGQSDITVRSLMTHFSGMPPDLILKPRWSGYEIGIQKALVTEPIAMPGARLIYSDIDSILMGDIVRRLSGETPPQFAHEQVFAPLGMIDSQFQPPVSLRARIAPTQIDPDAGGQPLKGLVLDPASRYMSGVARHSGLFTTADDLAKFAEMLLGFGQGNGVRVLQPATVKRFTKPGSLADQPILRGLGWDIDFSYSTNLELYPIGSLGYTDYTGPEMWMDPTTNSFVTLLTNVAHPNGIKSLSSLHSRVAAVFGLNLPGTVSPTSYNEIMGAGVHRVVNRDVKTLAGIDVLEEDGFAELKGKRIGLLTNQTGFDRAGRRDVDAMLAAGVQVVSLFSPEHGFSVSQDTENIPDTKDSSTGLPVVSLYEPGKRRLTAEQMRNLDAVVYDVQDVGTRFWTYSCTLLYEVEESGKAKKPFFVLDRPNPITGTHVEGPMLENDLHSFTGCYEMPLRHGMTFGELLRWRTRNSIGEPIFESSSSRTGVCHEASKDLQSCIEDGSGPPGVGFQELASNHPELLRSKGVVVNVRGKGVREDVR